ncbi:hypothetical protein ACFV06_21670 [Streptomyces sp. NPDC059618]|uniref:hypothetical protein n=1 Tax=Streptomyces sp. NPDC059618 TaxID=3346887 RepID=UPI0036915E65
MSRQAGLAHRDHDQGLAFTLAVLLLTGGVLLMSCWTGPLATFAIVAVLVVTAYTAPPSPAAWPCAAPSAGSCAPCPAPEYRARSPGPNVARPPRASGVAVRGSGVVVGAVVEVPQ